MPVCTGGEQRIQEAYKEDTFTMLSTQDDWKEVAHEFGQRWNFHHCCGAIDGKKSIKKPKKNANYSFLWCKMGANSSCSDAGVFNESSLRGALEDNTDLLHQIHFQSKTGPFPYFLVGDDAFPLRNGLIKPYSRRALTKRELSTHRVLLWRTLLGYWLTGGGAYSPPCRRSLTR
ncbi:hypothetical protein Bbelb_241500 [Branchiostoma belcheri]|nr:hypothetical protein Bbelb_241500 [Branchiostoma belcheri]